MLKLIKAELYRYSKSSFMYVFGGTMIFLIIFLMLNIKGILNVDVVRFEGMTRMELITIISYGFHFILYLMMIFGVVINEDYREGTTKNLLSSKITRTQVFFGKFITQIILAYILATISMLVFLAMLTTLEPGDGYSIKIVRDFVFRLYICTIPYVGGIAIVNFLSVLFKKQSIVCIIYYFGVMSIFNVMLLLKRFCWSGAESVMNILLSYNIQRLVEPFKPWRDVYITLGVGVIYIIVFTTMSIVIYKRQEC